MNSEVSTAPAASVQSHRGLGNRLTPESKVQWNLLNEDVSLPAAILSLTALKNNLLWMQDFADQYGVKLAPHGKTTMSPALFNMQRECGAWGLSLASAPAVELAWRFGFSRILLVNQLVGKRNMEIISQVLAKDSKFQFACLVDSEKNVADLGQFFHERGQRLRVMIEIGVTGGRAGVRTVGQELKVIKEIQKWAGTLSLVGVEVYEGVLSEEDAVRNLLTHVANRTRELLKADVFGESPIILSGGGSSWFDVVAQEFAVLVQEGLPVEVVLRPGCYLTHDVGHYQAARLRMEKALVVPPFRSLLPSLQIWAYVQSVPEPGYAVVTLGKKDASEIAGYPVPALHYRPRISNEENDNLRLEPINIKNKGLKMVKMMDQHSMVQFDENEMFNLSVGDMIAFDICHPCTTTNKWKNILLINETFTVIDIIQTYF